MRYAVRLLIFSLCMVACGGRDEGSGEQATPTSRLKVTVEPELTKVPVTTPKLLEKMTLEEKVGQMFLVRCPEDASEAISEYKLGGFVLFARDFEGETKESAKEKIAFYQGVSDIPMIISVDEEGGSVVRVSKYPDFREYPFLSPREIYASGGMEGIAEDVTEKAELLLSLGVNVNLAPVCDISESNGAFMYSRSFGGTPEETAEYVKTVVKTAKDIGLGSVLKHFPGYGDNADTHEDIVYDNRSYEVYEKEDFKPFIAGIEAGSGAILVSHNFVRCMDAGRPASLSPEVHRILREELGFEGVILTDDLYMDGIQEFMGKEAAAVTAVLAGNDMLCCTDYDVQIPAVIAAVEDGRIPEEQIDASVLRILKWKAELGILK